MSEAAFIAERLADGMPALVARLLPRGSRAGSEWRRGSVAGDPGGSLAVRLSGARRGLWFDHATGETGDALDLVAAVLFAGNIGEALKWAQAWLNLGDAPAKGSSPAAAPAPEVAAAEEAADLEWRRRAALALFLAAQPSIAGTPAALYLAGRGIDLAEMGRQPRSLRFHPALFNRELGRAWPALLAAVCSAAGQHVGVHRTWLARAEAGVWHKAPLRDPKMTLGSVGGGTIRIWRGATRRPLAHATPGDTVAIAEGIETALSVAIACPELRVLSAVSLGNLARVVLPPTIGTVIVCADNDEKDAARRALDRAVQHFLDDGRIVRIARAPVGKDFNDTLRAASA